MSDRVNVSIAFREDLIGDSAQTDSFYVKVTPVVKIKPVITAESLKRDTVRALREAMKKKGPIK